MLAAAGTFGAWETVAGIIGGLTLVVGALVKFVPKVRELWLKLGLRARSAEAKVTAKMELEASLKAMRRVAALKAVLHQWVEAKGVQRALLLVANNGGDEWKGQGPLFVSNPAQATGPGEPNTQAMWNQWRCDPWYVEALGRLLETFANKRGMLLVRDRNVGGELLTQYGLQGTVASVVLPFHWEPGGVLWYVSLNFGRCERLPGPETPHAMTDDEIQRHVENARAIYDDPGRVRSLIDSLHGAFQSVR